MEAFTIQKLVNLFSFILLVKFGKIVASFFQEHFRNAVAAEACASSDSLPKPVRFGSSLDFYRRIGLALRQNPT